MSAFRGSVAIVTGGASGIGRAVCEALGARGATVVVADINADGAQAVAGGISQAGGQATAVPVDTADGDAVQRLVDDTVAAHGQLDYMFNNAGIAVVGDYRDMTLEDWRRVIDVNLWGVIYGAHAAYRVMVAQGSGHIVNTASMAGLAPAPMLTIYSTAKWGVAGLSASLRAEGAALGVKVSVVCPGIVHTPLADELGAGGVISQKDYDRTTKLFVAPSAAAVAILRGVERNRATIVFPFSARVIWWLYRLHPVFVAPLLWVLLSMVRGQRDKKT